MTFALGPLQFGAQLTRTVDRTVEVGGTTFGLRSARLALAATWRGRGFMTGFWAWPAGVEALNGPLAGRRWSPPWRVRLARFVSGL